MLLPLLLTAFTAPFPIVFLSLLSPTLKTTRSLALCLERLPSKPPPRSPPALDWTASALRVAVRWKRTGHRTAGIRSEGGRGTPQGRREAGIEADALSESTRDTSRPADHAPTSAAPTSDKCGFPMKAKIAPPFRRENKLPLCYSIRKESLLGYKEWAKH